jgi:multiple sugar transport system substrate-binding protein
MDDLEKKPGFLTGGKVTRREVLKTGVIAAAGLTVLPAVIAACGGSSATPAPAVKVGSNHSDASELSGMQAIDAAFATATGVTPTLNTVDHDTFQDQINNYLGGTPDDVFTWFSGFRMRFFASKGLATAIDDVWSQAGVSSNFTAGFTGSVTGNDNHIYGIPVDYYPWCVFYRKSVWATKNYQIPADWTSFLALCKQMQTDGLTPIAFSDKDGWPAMGTFDILDLRLNGYDYHVNLMTGANGVKWTDAQVTKVFQTWAQIVPFYTNGYAGLTWQQACDTLVQKTSGMFFLGLFMTGEVATVDSTAVDDIDFFPWPNMGASYDAEKALDAPIDIWMMSANSKTLQQNMATAQQYLAFWAKGTTQVLMYKANNGFIPTASDADTSVYDVLTQKAVTIVSSANKITQFMDRDSRPDFAGANGMQSFLLTFLNAPTADTTQLQGQIQAFWDALPAYNATPNGTFNPVPATPTPAAS